MLSTDASDDPDGGWRRDHRKLLTTLTGVADAVIAAWHRCLGGDQPRIAARTEAVRAVTGVTALQNYPARVFRTFTENFHWWSLSSYQNDTYDAYGLSSGLSIFVSKSG